MLKNKKVVIISFLIIVILLIGYIYVFTSIGTGQSILSENQKENFKQELFNMEVEGAEDYSPLQYTSKFTIDIFGIEEDKDIIKIYGYSDIWTAVNFKGSAYVMEGGSGYFYAQTKVKNDNIEIVNLENVSKQYTLSKFSLRYKIKAKFYNEDNIVSETKGKIEKQLGVPFDEKWTLSIKNNQYELYAIDKNNEIMYKDKGILDGVSE